MKAVISSEPAVRKTARQDLPDGWSCAAATERARNERHFAPSPGNASTGTGSRTDKPPPGFALGPRLRPRSGEEREIGGDSASFPRRHTEKPQGSYLARRTSPSAPCSPLGKDDVRGSAPRPAPPLHKEGTPPGLPRPPALRPTLAEGWGPAAAAAGGAARRPGGNSCSLSRAGRRGAGSGRPRPPRAARPYPPAQPAPRRPPLRALLAGSPPRGRACPGTTSRSPCRSPHSAAEPPATLPPSLTCTGAAAASPLPSRPVSSPLGARRQAPSRPRSYQPQQQVPGAAHAPGPAAGPGGPGMADRDQGGGRWRLPVPRCRKGRSSLPVLRAVSPAFLSRPCGRDGPLTKTTGGESPSFFCPAAPSQLPPVCHGGREAPSPGFIQRGVVSAQETVGAVLGAGRQQLPSPRAVRAFNAS